MSVTVAFSEDSSCIITGAKSPVEAPRALVSVMQSFYSDHWLRWLNNICLVLVFGIVVLASERGVFQQQLDLFLLKHFVPKVTMAIDALFAAKRDVVTMTTG